MVPKSFEELFSFYHEYVKLLYSTIQIDSPMPVEVLFEINAAFDHLSRKWIYDETEEYVVIKTFSHLKRACLDIFKINLRNANQQYNELKQIDTSIIDNGEFDKDLNDLYYQIKIKAASARQIEGDKRNDNPDLIVAFEPWQEVYELTKKLESKFYLHKSLDWARKKSKLVSLKSLIVSIIISFIVGLVVGHQSDWTILV